MDNITFQDFDNDDSKLLQAQLELSRLRQLLRVGGALVDEKNRQMFLTEVKLQECEQRLTAAESLLIDLGFKRNEDGVWVCQTPRRIRLSHAQ